MASYITLSELRELEKELKNELEATEKSIYAREG
jgi:hypothetical protein